MEGGSKTESSLLEILQLVELKQGAPGWVQSGCIAVASVVPFVAVAVGVLLGLRGLLGSEVGWEGVLDAERHSPADWGLAAGLTVLLYLLYREWTKPSTAAPPRILFKPDGPGFNQLRRETFPPPYPNGWFLLVASEELEAGAPPKPFSVCGVEVIAFRGQDGQAAVLDAFCPHLGAHLGVGSRVVGNCVECPFHQWKFDAAGKCTDIPYLDSGVPASAKTHAYPVEERVGSVFFWFDAERRPPQWEITIPARLEDGSMYFGGVTQLYFRMHVAEMAENSADPYHFNNLHAPFPLPVLDRFLSIRHRIVLDFPSSPPEGSHMCLFRELATPLLFSRWPLYPEQTTNLLFDGPSFVHFMLSTPLGRIHLFKSALPIGPLQTVTEDRWYADHSVPRWFGWLMARVAKGALEQDRSVWEHKIYRSKPMLMKGERDFHRHRRWYRQFYSQHSFTCSSKPDPTSLRW